MLNDAEAQKHMNEELKGVPETSNNIQRAMISAVENTPVQRQPNVWGIIDNSYNSKTGLSLVHPLALITLILQENPWVDHACKVIGSACASTNPQFRITSSASGRNKKKAAGAKIDKLHDKLTYPNPHQTGYELFLTTFENLAGYGNAYWQIIRTKGGDIHSIYTLPPETIRVIPYFDQYGIMHYAYYQLHAINQNGKQDVSTFTEDEIIHFKDTNEKSFVYGKPRCYPLVTMITSDIESQQAITNWFSEGFSGGTIFKMDADENVANRNREFLRDMYSGAKNFGKILLLEGSTELVSDGNKFIGNINFEGLANLNRDNILQAMGVPLSMAGVRSDAGQANIEVITSEESAFLRGTVDRYHKLVFSKLNARFLRGILKEENFDNIEIGPGVMSKFNLSNEIKIIESLSKFGISMGEARELLGVEQLPSEKANETYVISTNNGSSNVGDILGIDPNTGEKVETLFEKGMADHNGHMTTPSSNKNGLGGDLKKVADGKK